MILWRVIQQLLGRSVVGASSVAIALTGANFRRNSSKLRLSTLETHGMRMPPRKLGCFIGDIGASARAILHGVFRPA